MQVLYSHCCGIDVHKDSVTACVFTLDQQGQRRLRKKQFATHVKALSQLRFWLYACKVTHVAMESTGVYWKPVWNELEGHFQLILANPYQIKNMPGKKTDAGDSAWIAELLAHGLIRPSFVPPREIRDLRELTRYRVKLTAERNRVHNRIHKVLEDAGIKLDTVATDILGASGRAIIQAIIAGQTHPDWLADKAKSRLRGKRNELRVVLRGHIREPHRWLLRELMEELEFVEGKMRRVEIELVQRMESYQDAVDRLCTIPGVDVLTAWTIIAELGTDMQVFASAKHAASWAGLCPGNFESAGKRLSNRTRKGNVWLRRALCQSGWAASRQKNSYVSASFYRRAAHHGMRKAVVATAHQLLIIAYQILKDGTRYQELGGDYFDRLHPNRTRNRLIRRLEQLGLEVTVKPTAAACADIEAVGPPTNL